MVVIMITIIPKMCGPLISCKTVSPFTMPEKKGQPDTSAVFVGLVCLSFLSTAISEI